MGSDFPTPPPHKTRISGSANIPSEANWTRSYSGALDPSPPDSEFPVSTSLQDPSSLFTRFIDSLDVRSTNCVWMRRRPSRDSQY